MKRKKVFVSGCFDMLHSGHVAFFEEAATLGDVHVGIGSDKTIFNLKNRKTETSQEERLYMIRSLKHITEAWINTGSGTIDFLDEIRQLQPDILFVNEDGVSETKKELCRELGIELVVSRRVPKDRFPARSTTTLRARSIIPYRLDLAGGWLDQPFVSKHHPGPVITVSIEPDREFNHRSGMSSSTRDKAIEIWGHRLPDDDPEKLARILFSFENPPGKKEISGSQDSIGIVYAGLNKLHYDGGYWPVSIEPNKDEETLKWVENHLHFVPLGPRRSGFDVLASTHIHSSNAKALADAAEAAWKAIGQRDLGSFGQAFTASFRAQVKMFPNMVTREVEDAIRSIQEDAQGWKLSGAGGGGYLVVVSEREPKGSFRIRIRREHNE